MIRSANDGELAEPAVKRSLDSFLEALCAAELERARRSLAPGGPFARLAEVYGEDLLRTLSGAAGDESWRVVGIERCDDEATVEGVWRSGGTPLTARLRRQPDGWRVDEIHPLRRGAPITRSSLGRELWGLYRGDRLPPLRAPLRTPLACSVVDEQRARGGTFVEVADAVLESREHAEGFARLGFGLRGCWRWSPVSRVYRAEAVESARPVVVKLPSAEADFRRRFRREIAVLRALDGTPGIVALRTAGRLDQVPFHVCDPARGTRMVELLRASRAPLAARLGPVVATARVAERMHSRRICHRDIAPDNLFVERPDAIELIDFGMARRARDRERFDADRQFDVFSLGLVLAEALLGRSVLRYHHPELSDDLARALPEIERLALPAELLTVARRALAAGPESGEAALYAPYASAAELAADLERWVAYG